MVTGQAAATFECIHWCLECILDSVQLSVETGARVVC